MIETNKIYNECCLKTMKRMEDGSVDMVVTSPPYNMRTRIRNGKYTTREKSEHFSKKYSYYDDALPIEDFYNFHKQALSEMLRVSKIVLYNIQMDSIHMKRVPCHNGHRKGLLAQEKN